VKRTGVARRVERNRLFQQGALERTPGGQPAELERDTLAGALDRLDEHADHDGYAVSPCDLCLDDLVLVQEAGPEWE
jgi:hypothetical protein